MGWFQSGVTGITCFLIFCRFVPVIAIAEVKGVLGVKKETAAGESVQEVTA